MGQDARLHGRRERPRLRYWFMNETNHQKGLLRVMVLGTAISFGAMAALVVSMKDFFAGNAAFEFSYKTVVAFVLGCLAGWAFWKLIRRWKGN